MAGGADGQSVHSLLVYTRKRTSWHQESAWQAEGTALASAVHSSAQLLGGWSCTLWCTHSATTERGALTGSGALIVRRQSGDAQCTG